MMLLLYITTRHEQAAVSMTDAEAGVSTRLGVALVHASPELLNATLGLGFAYRDQSRVLLLVGNVPRRLRGTEAWIKADVESSVKSVSKSYHYIGSGSEAAESLVETVKSLFSPPGGPAVIEIPRDVWREPVQMPAGFWKELSGVAG